MKLFALAAVAAAGVLLTSGTADAQILRGGGLGGGFGGGRGGYYNSYPYNGYGYGSGYGYSNSGYGYPGYGYPGSSNWVSGYPNSGCPSSGYSAYSNPCGYTPSPSYYSGGVRTSGYTPVGTSGMVMPAGGTGTYGPAAGSMYSTPTYTYPSTYYSYPSGYYDSYSYPAYSSGNSSRRLFGFMR